jgi:hypothetical protein
LASIAAAIVTLTGALLSTVSALSAIAGMLTTLTTVTALTTALLASAALAALTLALLVVFTLLIVFVVLCHLLPPVTKKAKVMPVYLGTSVTSNVATKRRNHHRLRTKRNKFCNCRDNVKSS